MADEVDLANCLIDSEISRALSKLRQKSSQESEGAKFCIECGETMPVERQNLGFKLCVPCASEQERRESLFADY